jgi:hypothetical protein
VGCGSVFYDYLNLFLSVTYGYASKRRDFQDASESESVQQSKSGEGEFSTSSRKRRSIYSSRGNSNLCDSDLEVDSENETTSSFKQPSQPPATKLIRPAKKPCVSVFSHDSDKHSVIEEEDVTVLPASKKVNVCVFSMFSLIGTSSFPNIHHLRPGRSKSKKGEATEE